MGCYDSVRGAIVGSGAWPYEEGALATKLAAVAASGGLGAAVGSPTELLKVCMQAGGWRRGAPRHASTWAWASAAFETRGVAGLFEGQLAFVQRSAVLTAAQIPSYEVAKRTLAERLGMREGNAMHFAASISAGLAATAACSPLDFAKSRVMNDVGGQLRGSALRALTQAVRHEGLLAPYSGFFANWARIGPHTMVTFLSYEWLRKLASWESLGA